MTTRKDTDRPPVHAIVLLPCPFCGSSDVYIDEADDGFARWVSCDQCETTGPVNPKGSFEHSRRDVADAWNARSRNDEIETIIVNNVMGWGE